MVNQFSSNLKYGESNVLCTGVVGIGVSMRVVDVSVCVCVKIECGILNNFYMLKLPLLKLSVDIFEAQSKLSLEGCRK